MQEPKFSLPDFPIPAKLFCTAFFLLLGVGVLVAEVKVVLKYQMTDGKAGLSVQDLILAYYGHPGASLIEQKINLSPSPDHRPFKGKVDYLIEWTKAGASPKEEDFQQVVEIVENNCVNCHDADGAASSTPFWRERVVKHELIAPLFRKTGILSVSRLAHLTHIHLLTNVMIFVMTGAVVLCCPMGSVAKSILVLLPFASIAMDIGSWWLTAFVSYRFAYAIMAGGLLMGISFLAQFAAAMHGMWLASGKQGPAEG